MKITKIEITNVKGISNGIFNFEIIPNKPIFFVAPNGFGKSSIAIAFDSLKPTKLELNENNWHNNTVTNLPELHITIEDGARVRTVTADTTTNTIKNEFNVFVINSKLISKAKVLNIGGTRVAKSSLEIEPTVLINSIPEKKSFNYNHAIEKRLFGSNGKTLPDISDLLQCEDLLKNIFSEIDFRKFSQTSYTKIINSINHEINMQVGTTDFLIDYINREKENEIRSKSEINKLCDLIIQFSKGIFNSIATAYLASLQIIHLHGVDRQGFFKAIKYQLYLSEKKEITDALIFINTTRLKIKPSEEKNQLVIKWPKVHEISNGQRDSMAFFIMLILARKKLTNNNNILIIDEIFDYLDDGNLISFQYFVSQLIESYKKEGKNIFPILLTHLDPNYFNHFCFNKHKIKVFYLQPIKNKLTHNVLELIKSRVNPLIMGDLDKYFFHFHPDNVDLSTEFAALNLFAGYSKSEDFHAYISKQVEIFCKNDNKYDPLSICFGLRINIEKFLYNSLPNDENKKTFLDTHSTKLKISYCESIGLDVPEIFYLLGLIYNSNLHWNTERDIYQPLASQLENFTIHKMVETVLSM